MGKREQKQAVASALLQVAGDLVEFWEDRFAALGEEPPCDSEYARECLAGWLKTLPGDDWDTRLGDLS